MLLFAAETIPPQQTPQARISSLHGNLIIFQSYLNPDLVGSLINKLLTLQKDKENAEAQLAHLEKTFERIRNEHQWQKPIISGCGAKIQHGF